MPHYFVSIWYQNVSLISHCWKWPITGHRNLVPIYLKVRQLLFQVSILLVKKLFSPLTINVVTVHSPSVANLNKTAEKNQFYCIFNLSSNSCNKQILQSDKKVSDQHGGIKCTGQFQQLQSDQWSSISHFRFPLIISSTLQIFIFYSKLKCGQIEVEWQHINR